MRFRKRGGKCWKNEVNMCKALLHGADSNNATCMGIFIIHSMAERTTNSQASNAPIKPQHLKLYIHIHMHTHIHIFFHIYEKNSDLYQ